MSEGSLLSTIGAWSAAGVAMVGSVAMVLRRVSKDRTEMTKDRVERTFVELLLKERDAALASARDAWRDHQEATEAIARLTAENMHQAREIERLTLEFAAFKRALTRLYPETRQFLVSDFQPMP